MFQLTKDEQKLIIAILLSVLLGSTVKYFRHRIEPAVPAQQSKDEGRGMKDE